MKRLYVSGASRHNRDVPFLFCLSFNMERILQIELDLFKDNEQLCE